MELQKLSESQLQSLAIGGQLALQGIAMVLSAFFPSTPCAATTPVRDTLREKECWEYLGCGRTKFRELIRAGEIPKGVKIAGYNQWPLDALAEFKNRQLAKESQHHVKRLRVS